MMLVHHFIKFYNGFTFFVVVVFIYNGLLLFFLFS